jgi:hypothetical protein
MIERNEKISVMMSVLLQLLVNMRGGRDIAGGSGRGGMSRDTPWLGFPGLRGKNLKDK